MFTKEKRKNTTDVKFQPGGCLSAYLVAQLYFVFVALGGVIFLLGSGALFTQPILLIWLMIMGAVTVLIWSSIISMWEGERKGYYGLILSYTLFFLYFLAYTYMYGQAGIPYLVLMIINLILLVLMIRPRRHLLASS